MRTAPRRYGLLAEFDDPHKLVAAAARAYDEGYRRLDAYSPFPVEGLDEALHLGHTFMPLIVLLGGMAGCLGGYAMEYWMSAVDYPLNVAGRPLNSWPLFIPITFELTVLCAGLSAVFGMLWLNRLPQPYHPIFNGKRFELASQTRFFLCIEADDVRFQPGVTRRFLETLQPVEVSDVDWLPA